MEVKDLIEKGKAYLQKLVKRKSAPSSSEDHLPRMDTPSYSLGEEWSRQGLLGGDDVNLAMAKELGIPVMDTLELSLPREIYKKVSYSFAKKHLVIPIKEENGVIVVAIHDPLQLEPIEELHLILDKEIKTVYSSKESILSCINDCYNKEQGEASQMIADLRKDESTGEVVEVYDLLDEAKGQASIIKLLNLIISEAIQQGASDIHFEPYENSMRVRYRIDGVLHNRHAPALEYQSQLMTRVKVMSKLDIAERRLPQDGRIKLKMGRREIDFRVSTVPVSGGERIVMRILDKGNVVLGLDRMGMLPDMYDSFKKLITLPEGIVLVTGPTGSGKTTTLYSALFDLYNDEINIMTIEDPVEYHLKGIAQIGVQPKINLDFATGLRHILRQDPDVIMIGEIRDKETAEIAIQSSLTGHLVLSTLHTNDAPSAITRLVDMGIEPYLLSSTVVGVLAQRLVRRICPDCKESYTPNEKELQSIGLTKGMLQENLLYRGKGCSSCYGYGYKGRHGIYELLTVNHHIQTQIVKSADAVELRRIALNQGMVSLREHGAELVRKGITTITEVLRAVRAVEE